MLSIILWLAVSNAYELKQGDFIKLRTPNGDEGKLVKPLLFEVRRNEKVNYSDKLIENINLGSTNYWQINYDVMTVQAAIDSGSKINLPTVDKKNLDRQAELIRQNIAKKSPTAEKLIHSMELDNRQLFEKVNECQGKLDAIKDVEEQLSNRLAPSK